jgi:hypothetical protein
MQTIRSFETTPDLTASRMIVASGVRKTYRSGPVVVDALGLEPVVDSSVRGVHIDELVRNTGWIIMNPSPRSRSTRKPGNASRRSATSGRHCCIEVARHSPARREAPDRRFVRPGIDPSGVV